MAAPSMPRNGISSRLSTTFSPAADRIDSSTSPERLRICRPADVTGKSPCSATPPITHGMMAAPARYFSEATSASSGSDTADTPATIGMANSRYRWNTRCRNFCVAVSPSSAHRRSTMGVTAPVKAVTSTAPI